MSEEKKNPGKYVTPKFCDERHRALEKLLDEKLKSHRNWLIGIVAASAFWLSVLQFLLNHFS